MPVGEDERKMNRFFVCLLFDARLGAKSGPVVMTEQSIRFVVAANPAAAQAKARLLGEGSEHEYLNDAGETVYWTFVKVVDVQEFCENDFVDGVEVYSRLDEVE